MLTATDHKLQKS